MASAVREYRYNHRDVSIDGSLARDLDWAVRERELEHAGAAPRHEKQARPKVHRREQALVRERQQVPVLTVAGVAAVIGLAVMLLLSYLPVFPAFLKLRREDAKTPRPFRVPGSDTALKWIAYVPMVLIVISIIFTAVPLSFDAETLASFLPITIGSILSVAIGEVLIALRGKNARS